MRRRVMTTQVSTPVIAITILLLGFGVPLPAGAQDKDGLELVNDAMTFSTWRDAAVGQLTTDLNALKDGNVKSLKDTLTTSIEQLRGLDTNNLENKLIAQLLFDKANNAVSGFRLVGAGAELYVAVLDLAFKTLADKGLDVGALLDKTLDFLITGAKVAGNKAEVKTLENAKALLKALKDGKDVLDKLKDTLKTARRLISVSTHLVPQPSPSDQALVAITVSGFGEGQPPSLGAFQVDVGFDPEVLMPTAVAFGPFLGDLGLGQALADFSFRAEIVRLSETSFLSPTALDALQPSDFAVASILFQRIGEGDGRLSFADIVLTDAFGDNLLAPGSPISETPSPTNLYLLGMALLVMAGVAHRRQRGKRRRGVLDNEA